MTISSVFRSSGQGQGCRKLHACDGALRDGCFDGIGREAGQPLKFPGCPDSRMVRRYRNVSSCTAETQGRRWFCHNVPELRSSGATMGPLRLCLSLRGSARRYPDDSRRVDVAVYPGRPFHRRHWRSLGIQGCLHRQARVEMRLRRWRQQRTAWFRVSDGEPYDGCHGGLDDFRRWASFTDRQYRHAFCSLAESAAYSSARKSRRARTEGKRPRRDGKAAWIMPLRVPSRVEDQPIVLPSRPPE